MTDTYFNLITNKLDFYGKSFNLHIFGKEKYKTKLGAAFGIISILLIVAITYYFILDLTNHNVMTVIFNQDETSRPLINLTNMPIIFTISDATGNILRPDRLFNFDFKKFEVFPQITKGNVILNPQLIPVEPCLKEKHIPEEYEKYFTEINLDNFYCANNKNFNLTLYGKYGDYINGFSVLNLYVNRCVNTTSTETNSTKCFDDSTIEKKLTNMYFNIAFLSYQVNNYNSTHSGQLRLQTISNEITTTLLKRYRYLINHVIYDTDYGLIFENKIRENYFKYESYELDVDTKNSGIITSSSNFVNFSIRCSNNIHLYQRSYLKLQTFLANVGGILNSIMIICEIILNIITRRFYLVDVLNSLFFYKFEKEISDKKNINDVKLNILNNSNLNIQNLSILSLPVPDIENLDNNNFHNLNKNTEIRNKKLIISNKDKPSENKLHHIFSKNNNDNNNSNLHLQSYENYIIKHSKIKLSIKELIFPKFCFRNKNKYKIEKLESCENFIKQSISLEHILEKFYELNIIINKVFNNDEINELKRNKIKILNPFLINFEKNISEFNSNENNKETSKNNLQPHIITNTIIEIKNLRKNCKEV